MIDKAFGLQEACQQAVMNPTTAMYAMQVLDATTEEERNNALATFAMTLTSLTAAMVTQMLLTEEQNAELMATIEMLQGMENN